MAMDPVEEAIVAARVRLLFNYAFFGMLATRLVVVDASKWCRSMASDGKHLFYNREFVKALTPDELLFMIGHQVLHCAYDHLGRRGGRDRQFWDPAIDFVVNWTLSQEKLGVMPQGGLLDSRYTDDVGAEEIYRLLQTNGTSNLKSLDQHLDLNGEDGDGDGDEDGEGTATPRGGKDPRGNPDPGSETGVDYTKSPPVYTEDELNSLRNQVKAALINAIQSNTGNVPGGVVRLVNDFVNPTIDWRELLTQTIQSTFKEDYTFNQPSKRSWGLGGGCSVILPGQKWGSTVDICISLDTSGSISNDIFTAFLSEVRGIVEQYDDFRLHIWCIDAAIYNPQVFTPHNVDELDSYQPAGGGGNDFPLNWTYMRDNDIEPELFVVFSDGYPCGSWGDPDYCDTIFVIRNDWDKNIEAPFGLTVYMDD